MNSSTRTLLIVLVIIGLFSGNVWAQSTVKSSLVSYPSGQDKISGFLAEPETAGRYLGLVIIHEWWGLNAQIKDEAKKLAREGYVALAVDLYRGQVTRDPGQARRLSRSLPRERALRDMRAAIAFLKSRPNVRPDKIGSLGWCMGGGQNLILAINSPELSACVIYYGGLTSDRERLRRINCPVLGIFGEEDRAIPVAGVKTFEKAMKYLGKDISIYIYPRAGHAFANPTRGSSYRSEATADAWNKTLAFFNKHLMSR